MIYTVFQKDSNEPWQDFETYSEAKAYGDSLDCGYEIQLTEGEVV